MTLHGLGTVLWIDLRTGWKGLAGWILGIVAILAVSAVSITSLYDTPEKLRSYGASVTGGAMYMLNGKVAGLDTIGGVLANEFGFVVAFAVPVMAVALTGRATRRDESAGRHELLLASRIGRHAPLLAAVLVSGAALLLTGLGCAAVMAASDAPWARSLLYGLAMTGLGLVFTGVTAVAAQVVEHNRTVWGIALAVTVLSYLLRGLGAVRGGGLIWLSPHGWVDETRAFGDARAWPVLLLLGLAVALVGAAFWLSTLRDVGGALVRPQGAAPEATPFLRTPLGLAWHDHRGAVIGWTIGSAVLMGTYGSLSQEVLDAIEGNPALGEMLGSDPGLVADQLLATVTSTFLMMLAMVVAAFAIMAVSSLHAEEEAGRLEVQLSGDRSRTAWLAVHIAVAGFGVLLVGVVGALALAGSSAASTGEPDWFGEIMAASLGYLPGALVFLALTVAVFGAASRIRGLVWALFAVAAVLAYLGPGLDLPEALVRVSPFVTAGADLMTEDPGTAAVLALLALAALLGAAGFVGFRVRDVPRG